MTPKYFEKNFEILRNIYINSNVNLKLKMTPNVI